MKERIYVFIDSQNLNLGIRSQGWELDFKKFYVYLTNKFRIKKAFLFIGYMDRHRDLYEKLSSFGFILIFKNVVIDKNGKVKGNVDAELVLHSAKIEYYKYEKAIIVSGDGDFYCLIKYLQTKEKLLKILIPNQKGCSSLLKEFEKYKIFLNRERHYLKVGGVAQYHIGKGSYSPS